MPIFVAAAPALEVDVVAVVLVLIIEDELELRVTQTVVEEGDIKLSVVDETEVGEARGIFPEDRGVGVEIPMVMADETEGLARVSVRRGIMDEVSGPVGLGGRVAAWRADVTVVSLA